MIKRILLLLTISVLVVPILCADNAPSSSETKDTTVPIWIRKDGGGPNKHMPPANIPVQISINENSVWFAFPFADYPMQVDIEMESEPYGVWSTTLMDTQSFLDSFDGYSGDYKLTITTANGSSYVGYFTLE